MMQPVLTALMATSAFAYLDLLALSVKQNLTPAIRIHVSMEQHALVECITSPAHVTMALLVFNVKQILAHAEIAHAKHWEDTVRITETHLCAYVTQATLARIAKRKSTSVRQVHVRITELAMTTSTATCAIA